MNFDLVEANKSMLWVEKYRPQKVSDCILPSKIKDVLQGFVDKKEMPNLILAGTAGCGKTTVARALCNEMDCEVLFINASLDNGIDILRNKITTFASSISLTGQQKVVILDEAEYLSANFQPALRGFIEQFHGNVRFIFTCNYLNKLLPALHSRCAVITYDIPNDERKTMLEQIFKRICFILKNEQVQFNPKVVMNIVTTHFPDMRRCLQELQRYGTSGSIDETVQINSNHDNFEKLVSYVKARNFKEMRLWVGSNKDVSSEKVFDYFFTNADKFVVPNTIPQLVLATADYQYKASFVANKEINLTAYLTEIMANCEFLKDE